MHGHRERLNLLDRLVTDSVDLGLGQRNAEDHQTDGRHVRIDGRDLLNFGSCSYLGLELDERLIEAAIEAVRLHGIETSSSRVYLSSPLYAEFEDLVEKIFQANVVVAPTTTLGHLSALPALVDEDDAIVMDHQVHTSVQMACSLAKGTGTHLEIVPHNDLDRLEERVAQLSKLHRQVWYMADGVYSMFGDLAPTTEVVAMLDRNPQMRFYVDDAHGMSWCGPRGMGSVLNAVDLHPRMILATGLAKGFGTGGGLIVLPNEEEKRRVRTCGPTLLFCGPLQPPILGAAIASAKIHLSDEIESLQNDLRERMEFCDSLFREHQLPVISDARTPVGFLGMGPTRACQNLCVRLMEEDFYINPAQFPAAPVRRSGGRFLLTRHHRFEDIERLVAAVAKHWEPSIRDAGSTPEEVWQAFGLEPPVAHNTRSTFSTEINLHLESCDSVEKLDRAEWDQMMSGRGCLDSGAVLLFEQVFGHAREPENHWDFRYYIVRDETGAAVLATCFTAALWKADMLSPAEVSRRVEARRTEDPFFLSQRVFSMGCLLSEGEHLWLRDFAESPITRRAIEILLEAVREDARLLDCSVKVVRDIPGSSPGLASRFKEEGLFELAAPDSLVLDVIEETEERHIAQLSRRHRRHHAREVEPFNNAYRVELIGHQGRALDPNESEALYALYQNVKSHSLDLNTFALPRDFLPKMAEAPSWEILIYRSKDSPDGPPVGFSACHWNQSVYVPLFLGLDYDYVYTQGLYRQQLRNVVERARELSCQRVAFGFEASLEKRRFGARPLASSMFVEADDHFAFDALAQISSHSA